MLIKVKKLINIIIFSFIAARARSIAHTTRPIADQHFVTATFVFYNVAIELQKHPLIYLLLGQLQSRAWYHTWTNTMHNVSHLVWLMLCMMSMVANHTMHVCPPIALEYAMHCMWHCSANCAATLLACPTHRGALPNAIQTQIAMSLQLRCLQMRFTM